MDDALEMLLAVVVAALALVSAYVMAVGYHRTNSRRLYWATLAFFLFAVKGAMVFFGGLTHAMTAEAVQLFEFSADTAILVLFTISLVVTPAGGVSPVE